MASALLPGLALGLTLMLGACADEPPVVEPAVGEPRLTKEGELQGVIGVGQADWAALDPDLRRSIFWLGFVRRLTGECKGLFPEHLAWLGELDGLVTRGLGVPSDVAVNMERTRLKAAGEGHVRAIVALDAMRVAEMDIEGMLLDQLQAAGRSGADARSALVFGCGLLFDETGRRGLLRSVSQPLGAYFDRMVTDHSTITNAYPRLPAFRRRLERI